MSPLLIGAGMAAGNTALNAIGIGQQTGASKDLMRYQWDNFMSPAAQVREMAKAGLNPAAMFGDGKGAFASPSVAMPSSIPVQMGGVDTLANYLVAKSQAKKNDVDTHLLDIEAQNKQFELDLNRAFASKERVANLLSAYKALQLQDDEHSRNEWQIAKEKALSELTGIQKDTAQKVLDNMDTQIMQENKQREESINLTKEKQKTEKTAQSSNLASARYSNALADTEDGLRELKKASQIILNGIEAVKYEEDSKTLQSKIDKLAAEVGIAKWTAILQEVEARDKNAYNAIQRLIMGKSVKGDASTIIQALSNYEKFTFKH